MLTSGGIDHAQYEGKYYDEYNNVYTNDHERLTLLLPCGKFLASDYGDTSDLYPYNTNNSLTAESNPAATLYNKNSDGTKYMHVDIKGHQCGIRRNSLAHLEQGQTRSNGGGGRDRSRYSCHTIWLSLVVPVV